MLEKSRTLLTQKINGCCQKPIGQGKKLLTHHSLKLGTNATKNIVSLKTSPKSQAKNA
jgi:hypothetical protein